MADDDDITVCGPPPSPQIHSARLQSDVYAGSAPEPATPEAPLDPLFEILKSPDNGRSIIAGPTGDVQEWIGCYSLTCLLTKVNNKSTTHPGTGNIKCRGRKACHRMAHKRCIRYKKTWICWECKKRRKARPRRHRRPAPPPLPTRIRKRRKAAMKAARRITDQLRPQSTARDAR